MTFTLYVDEQRWRAHLRATVASEPAIVPVIKGNGYGLGNERLAAEAALLGVDTVAVGTPDELPVVQAAFPGDVLVLTPSYPAPFDDPSGRVVQTAAHLPTLAAGGGARVVVEAVTSMHRHGLAVEDVPALAGLLGGVRLEGLAFHLPMDRHGGYQPAAEVAGWLQRLAAAGVPTDTAWVSHLTAQRAGPPAQRLPGDDVPAADRDVAVARRPGGADGTRHGAGRAPARARHALRLPAAAGDAGQPPGGGQRRHRARRGPRGAADGARAGRAGQGAGRRHVGRGQPGAVAVPVGRQAAVVRRAAAHARVAAAAAGVRRAARDRHRARLRRPARPPCTPTPSPPSRRARPAPRPPLPAVDHVWQAGRHLARRRCLARCRWPRQA